MVNRTIHLGDSWAPDSYDPASDAGLVAWYKADDTSEGPRDAGGNVPSNTEEVTSWRDSGPHGYDLTKSGTQAAQFLTGALNGMPVVQSVNNSAVLRSVNDAISLTTTTLSVFCLLENQTGGEGAGVFTALYSSGATSNPYTQSGTFGIGQGGGTDQEFFVFGNNAHMGASGDTPLSFNTPTTVGLVLTGTTAYRYLAGVPVVPEGTAFSATIGNSVLEYLTMFAAYDATFIGVSRMYEMFVTTTDLSNQVDDVMDYFDSRWGTH
jgi:hypothetical protein